MSDELFKVLEEKKEHPNQSIDDVLINDFPELEDEINEKKGEEEIFEEDSMFEDDFF